MRTLIDYEGRAIRLTDERLEHILKHPEMRGMEQRIAETLRTLRKWWNPSAMPGRGCITGFT